MHFLWGVCIDWVSARYNQLKCMDMLFNISKSESPLAATLNRRLHDSRRRRRSDLMQ